MSDSKQPWELDERLVASTLDAIEDLILWNGGRLPGGGFAMLYAALPQARIVVTAAGGPRGLATDYWDRLCWIPRGPGGALRISAKRLQSIYSVQEHRLQERVEQIGSEQVMVELLEEVLEWSGGSVLASEIPGRLQRWKTCAHDFYIRLMSSRPTYLRQLVDGTDRFEWHHGRRAGQATIALRYDRLVRTVITACHELLLRSGGFVSKKAFLNSFCLRYRRLVSTLVEKTGGLQQMVELVPSWLRWCGPTSTRGPGVSLPAGGVNAYSEHAALAAIEAKMVRSITDLLDDYGGWMLLVDMESELQRCFPDLGLRTADLERFLQSHPRLLERRQERTGDDVYIFLARPLPSCTIFIVTESL